MQWCVQFYAAFINSNSGNDQNVLVETW
jgi:hypothetical protein